MIEFIYYTLRKIKKTIIFDNYIYENYIITVRNDVLTVIFKSISFMGSAIGVSVITAIIFIAVKDKK